MKKSKKTHESILDTPTGHVIMQELARHKIDEYAKKRDLSPRDKETLCMILIVNLLKKYLRQDTLIGKMIGSMRIMLAVISLLLITVTALFIKIFRSKSAPEKN